jgi:hypothetical protein
MTAIGGKHRKPKLPSQPQVVIQSACGINRFAVLGTDEVGCTVVTWTGDPSSATKYNSKYEAKSRVRDLLDIPESRVFHTLERSA